MEEVLGIGCCVVRFVLWEFNRDSNPGRLFTYHLLCSFVSLVPRSFHCATALRRHPLKCFKI